MTGAELISELRSPSRALDDRRRREVEGCLIRIVASCPGVSVREVVLRVRQDVPVQAAIVISVLRRMERRGEVQRRAWGNRHCLFPPHLNLEDWWQHVAVMRDGDLRLLYDVIRGGNWTLPEVCRIGWERHGWAASTTRARIQRLQDCGLVVMERPGHRNTPLRALRLHASAQEALEDVFST